MQANFLVLPVVVASVACVARGVLAGPTLDLVALMTAILPMRTLAFAVSPPIQTEAMT